jgi:hypothetical protein
MAFNLSVTAQELNNAVAKANAAAPQSTTYTKAEVNARIQAATPTVDQTFNAASANAQSGVAIAEALENNEVFTPDFSVQVQLDLVPNSTTTGGISLYASGSTTQAITTDLPNGTYMLDSVLEFGAIVFQIYESSGAKKIDVAPLVIPFNSTSATYSIAISDRRKCIRIGTTALSD